MYCLRIKYIAINHHIYFTNYCSTNQFVQIYLTLETDNYFQIN